MNSADREKTARFFNTLGKEYQELAAGAYEPIYSRTKSSIGPFFQGMVLDIGSGGVRLFDEAKIRGRVSCDVARSLLDLEDSSALPVCGEAAHLPFASGQFDVVLAHFSIHHFARSTRAKTDNYLQQSFNEMARVCKRGGRLIVAENLLSDTMEKFQRLLYPLQAGLLSIFNRPPVMLLSKNRLMGLMERAGFVPRVLRTFKTDADLLVVPGRLPGKLNPITVVVALGELS